MFQIYIGFFSILNLLVINFDLTAGAFSSPFLLPGRSTLSFVKTDQKQHLPVVSAPPRSSHIQMSSSSGPDIEVVSQPDEEFLEKKGVFNWGTWGCGVSTFPWTYDQNEQCYLLAGKVTVTPTDGRPSATFGKGDFVTFPAGMSCTWDVSEAVNKHFNFY